MSWEEDLNLRSREATDLQSVAIDHSAIPGCQDDKEEIILYMFSA